MEQSKAYTIARALYEAQQTHADGLGFGHLTLEWEDIGVNGRMLWVRPVKQLLEEGVIR